MFQNSRMSSNFLKITFSENQTLNENINEYEYRNKPFSNSPVYCASMENFVKLAGGTDVKTVYQLNLSLENIEYNFVPGDAIAILPENDLTEVQELFIRLNLEPLRDKRYNLEVLKETTKKNAAIPKHIPPSSTLWNVFLKHIDIRSPSKKIFLKSLLKYTENSKEKEKLELICSPSGTKEYIQLLNDHPTLLSLLNAFPSILPPVEVILEHSSPLNPRYFSVASSPLKRNNISIIFNVVEFESGLKGVCTGWLQELLHSSRDIRDIQIPFYFRKSGEFRLSSSEKPSVLIATGTGIAPFRGFLQHRQILSESGRSLAEVWLFYGCRYSDKDFLCKEELQKYVEKRVLTKLCIAFSRDSKEKVYVQQKILERKEEIADLILHRGATVFVCGNPKTVVKDIREAFIEVFMDGENADRTAAENVLSDLVQNKRYLVDSWI